MRNGLLKGAVLALTLGLSAPGQAQESSYTPGNYSDVSAIDVLDGQFENYMDYLAGPWKAQQEFAKSKGYITGYQVLANPYARAGEPDLSWSLSIRKSMTMPNRCGSKKSLKIS
ncbi:MAG: hypothetical protein IPF48_03490 [Sphingomonadales bacterium]|nr:hypothetical protein [Sphingomonadales bacterium]